MNLPLLLHTVTSVSRKPTHCCHSISVQPRGCVKVEESSNTTSHAPGTQLLCSLCNNSDHLCWIYSQCAKVFVPCVCAHGGRLVCGLVLFGFVLKQGFSGPCKQLWEENPPKWCSGGGWAQIFQIWECHYEATVPPPFMVRDGALNSFGHQSTHLRSSLLRENK